MKLVNIGFGNMVSAERIVTVISPDSAPIKRLLQGGRDKRVLLDATNGRRPRSEIDTDTDPVILSAVQPETIAGRVNGKDAGPEVEEAHD